ncbi:dethiobiotin synthase [Sphingopyxis yananensis]|uniref:dethiobiotin synthase n=1 Tax=Sphingopyxis yananensis TaxID=2886687 RepID=UPI001D0FFA2F|nr:dethiobiotin synthase [Sphingopyxis yananensis]MCC2603405.1 dethiobiotin synthase [Sphingopyxis yananensis]
MTKSFVVTGTDTGIGKTIFTAALAGALGISYWKPIQSGLDDETDSEAISRLCSVPIHPEAYRLKTPASPHLSAEIDQITIDPARLTPPTGDVVIEGAGGVLVPVTRQILYADLFAQWQIPTILVARTTLGTINHSLLSIEALRTRGVPIHGIAFVGPDNRDSEDTICAISGVRRLGRLPRLKTITRATLTEAFLDHFKLSDFS